MRTPLAGPCHHTLCGEREAPQLRGFLIYNHLVIYMPRNKGVINIILFFTLPHIDSHHMVIFTEGLQLMTPRKPELYNITGDKVNV